MGLTSAASMSLLGFPLFGVAAAVSSWRGVGRSSINSPATGHVGGSFDIFTFIERIVPGGRGHGTHVGGMLAIVVIRMVSVDPVPLGANQASLSGRRIGKKALVWGRGKRLIVCVSIIRSRNSLGE